MGTETLIAGGVALYGSSGPLPNKDINPITPVQDLPMLLLYSDKSKHQTPERIEPPSTNQEHGDEGDGQ